MIKYFIPRTDHIYLKPRTDPFFNPFFDPFFLTPFLTPFVVRICRIFFGPQVERSRFSVQISRSTSSVVRKVTDFGARLRYSKAFIPPSAWRATHLWPVLRLTPKLRHSSVMVKWPLPARLTNRCFCSMGDTFFQGMRSE